MQPYMKRVFFSSCVVFGILVPGTVFCRAGDWTQYRGNAGSGMCEEKAVAPWPAGGPKRIWTTKTPAGFSSFVVASGKVFTVIGREVEGKLAEICVALDGQTGKEIWATETGLAKY